MFLIIDLFSLYINLNHLKELDYKFENCCCYNVIHLILKNLNYHFFLIDVEVLLRNLLVRYFHYNLLNMIEKEMNLTLWITKFILNIKYKILQVIHMEIWHIIFYLKLKYFVYIKKNFFDNKILFNYYRFSLTSNYFYFL